MATIIVIIEVATIAAASIAKLGILNEIKKHQATSCGGNRKNESDGTGNGNSDVDDG